MLVDETDKYSCISTQLFSSEQLDRKLWKICHRLANMAELAGKTVAVPDEETLKRLVIGCAKNVQCMSLRDWLKLD